MLCFERSFGYYETVMNHSRNAESKMNGGYRRQIIGNKSEKQSVIGVDILPIL